MKSGRERGKCKRKKKKGEIILGEIKREKG
jgi:hypothetical protein